MFARSCSAAIVAALLILSSASSHAQQQAGPPAQNTSSYLPPPHLIAKEDPAKIAQKSAAAKRETGGKTIGLISLVSDRFIVRTIGVTAFGNEEHKVPIANWKLNDRIAAVVTSRLKKNFQIKSIPVSEGAIQKFNETNFLFKNYDEELSKFLASVAGAQHYDYYLVVAPGYDRVGTTNQELSGLGVVRMGSVLFGSSEFVYTYTRLLVFDDKFAPVRGVADFDDQFTLIPAALRGPHRELKEGERLPDDPKAAANDPRTRKITGDLLEASIAKTLPKLFATN